MQVLLTPTGPIPAWASRCGGSRRHAASASPNPQLFGAFVRALGTRYPTVKLWSILERAEPALVAAPAVRARRLGRGAASASIYRDLARSAIAGLRATGHRDAQIWLGETAPLGDDPGGCGPAQPARPGAVANRSARRLPETFLRGVFCLNTRGRRLTGTEARDQRCCGYKRLNVTGYAHHPYTRGGSRRRSRATNRGRDHDQHGLAADAPARPGGPREADPARLPIHYTEHGWQTNPPDLIFGVTDAQQAEYINQSDWIAYNNARVHTVAQYKIVDDENIGSGFQMGLRLFSGGARKPAYDAYKLPIWVSGKGSQVTVYGQVRPADAGAAVQVEVQNAASAGCGFQTVRPSP